MCALAASIVKPVGVGALFNTSRHALGICRRVCNTCRYIIPREASAGQSLERSIENAVAAVIMQHGILRVGITGEDSKEPCFTFVDVMDLQDFVDWRSLAGEGEEYEGSLLRSLERIHNMLWSDLTSRPGWEVIVHHGPNVDAEENATLDITFAFHHAYADGVASKLFHHDLLKALNNHEHPPVALRDHVLRFDSPPKLLPGMETTVPLNISWGFLLRTIWNEIIWENMVPSWLKSQPSPDSIPWTGEKISLEPHHVHLRMIEISRRTLEGVLRVCRTHKTTLTPLLHVLIAVSLATRMPAQTAPAFTTITPIDLRRYAKEEYDVTNNIVGMVSAHEDGFDSSILARLRNLSEQTRTGTDEPILQEASSLSARLRHKVSTLPNDDGVGMLSWVSDWKRFWTDKFGTKRGSTWEVSNIGSLDLSNAAGKAGMDGRCRITRSVMTQGALPAGAAFSVSVAGVQDEGICLSLSWQKTVVSDGLMEGIAADLRRCLSEIAEQESCRMPED